MQTGIILSMSYSCAILNFPDFYPSVYRFFGRSYIE